MRPFPMWCIVRDGVPELLELLHSFCDLYVYSHGLKNYVKAILEVLDPEHKYFDRGSKFLAPDT